MHQRDDKSDSPAIAHAAKDRKPFFTGVFVMLLLLTGMSFWVATSPLMDNPVTGWTAMMAISTAKAMLVILFFMHLWWEKSWKYVLTVPATIIGLVLVLLLIPDVGNRFATYSKTRRTSAPEPYHAAPLPNSLAGQSRAGQVASEVTPSKESQAE